MKKWIEKLRNSSEINKIEMVIFLTPVNWNSICQPKKYGGLGFQKFLDFN